MQNIPTRAPRWYDLDAQQIARLLIFGCAATVLTDELTGRPLGGGN